MPAIVVLGTPRSGTSMVAGILHNLGVAMGETLLPADRWNQLGYFEDVAFLHLHRVLGFPHGDPRRIALMMPADCPRPSPALLARYRRLCAARAVRPTWGMKDPRTVYLFDHFLASCDGEVRVVATRRDSEASRASLQDMLHWKQSDAAEAIVQYRLKLRLATERFPGPKLVIDYEEALADPAGCVSALAEFAGVPATPEARAFISPDLRRH